jgi:2-(1,2-epoxy-1,2-dihydrophenyl)acetyl-CoA isomerase
MSSDSQPNDETRAGAGASVELSRDGAVALIRLNRPERMNAVDEAMIEALRSALRMAEQDREVRVAVIIGEGRSLMAGADITLFNEDLEGAPATAGRLIDAFHAMLRVVRAMGKPVVVGVNGSVAGGGLGLALACDLCVISDDAQLISGYTKLGTSPDAGTTWSLTQLLGRRRALEVMWLNDPIGAQQALALGLANRVVPAARLVDETLALARRLAEGAPQAIAQTKALVEAAAASGFDAQLDRERAAFVAASGADAFREGITAFFERRAPRF